MKKLFLGVMAIAALVACNNENVIEKSQATIAFGDSFVQSSNTKPVGRAAADPTYNNDKTLLEAFDVWGFMTKNTGVVFDKERVTRTAEGWSYSNLAYWTTNRDYKFAALAPVDHSNIEVTLAVDNKYLSEDGALGTVTFTNLDGTDDLLYTTQTASTGDTIAAEPAPVHLMFKHLLSKVKFTFTNGFANQFTSMAISNVKMVVPAKGTIDLTQPTPWVWNIVDATNTTTLEFGNTTAPADETVTSVGVGQTLEVLNERLTFPLSTTQNIRIAYQVSFDVTLYQGDQIAYQETKTTTLEDVTLEMGRCYNITATLNAENLKLKPIEFSVEVEPWIDGGEIAGGVVNFN